MGIRTSPDHHVQYGRESLNPEPGGFSTTPAGHEEAVGTFHVWKKRSDVPGQGLGTLTWA